MSLDEFTDENDFNLTDGLTAEDSILNTEFYSELTNCYNSLKKEERLMARAILNRVPDKIVMKLLGIEKQSTYSSRKMKVREKLQAAMAEWL